MFFGLVVLSAIGHQVIHRQARTYDVFKKLLHPSVAIFWGISVPIALIVMGAIPHSPAQRNPES